MSSIPNGRGARFQPGHYEPHSAHRLLRLTHDHLARVPVPPAGANPAVPEVLSAVIMHLLEKEPDNRYQTADGVIYDLERVRGAGARPGALRVGEHDVPVRLLPPSRLVGPDDEVVALQERSRRRWRRRLVLALLLVFRLAGSEIGCLLRRAAPARWVRLEPTR
jgi:hypothetical protein